MKRVLSVFAVAALCLVAAPRPALAEADIIRESTGQRRADLDKMELQPFPGVWEGLGAWTGSDPIGKAQLDGKPVLMVNWASWNSSSARALALAQRMADKFGPAGLVVIGIHHPQGWDGAEEAAKARGVTFPLAHDATGAYRSALHVAHDPGYYVIDRAGNLRYAAVAAGSVEEALAEVTGETAEKAGDVPRLRRERDEHALAQSKRTTSIRTDFDLRTLPAVPPGYSQPGEQAYKDARWPRVQKELGKAFGLLDNNDKPLEPALGFEPIAWYPKRPETRGRVQVIYFWHPDVHVSYARAMNQMDLLQEQNLRDVAVIGALVGVRVLRADQNNAEETPDQAFEKLQKRYDAFVGARKFEHALAVDLAMTCLSSLNAQNGGQNFPVPGAMIVSTDGVIRWMGWIESPDFRSALDRVLASDPGIRARRAADRAYIENRKK